MSGGPAVSVVLCTCNRAQLLASALDALVDQEPDSPPHEIVVVDNNSRDGSRRVIESFASAWNVRYVFEGRQGLAAARNAGVGRAHAPIIAFTDDDVQVDRSWVSRIADSFARHPEAGWIGGRVEPIWPGDPPDWLREAGAAPLALVDYGDAGFAVTPRRPVCLVGANFAVRGRVFMRVGMFSLQTERRRDTIGSTEDHDFQIRCLAAGVTGWYDPDIAVRAVVPPDRLSKKYHRKWHTGHGRFFAMMREPSFEDSHAGYLFGVPAHVYRSAALEAGAWVSSAVRGRLSAAFAHELRFRFLVSFATQRILEAVR
jgi:glucosyl-dolichyl phosphate glucuronosyltransferase